jgi:hypothetical protein
MSLRPRHSLFDIADAAARPPPRWARALMPNALAAMAAITVTIMLAAAVLAASADPNVGDAGVAQPKSSVSPTSAAVTENDGKSGGGMSDGDTSVRIVQAGQTRLRVEVVDVSDAERVRLLQDWAEEAARASMLPSGRFPLRVATVRISEIDSRSTSPVPWGQTLRRDGVSVLLYVRRGATLAQLRADWTAVHEFAHLRHPYLGSDGRWLAEGLASYLQNTLRAKAGLLTEEDGWRRLDAGFRRGEAVGEGPAMARIGRSRDGTMRVYWVGAAYWLDADLALRRAHGTTLDAVFDRYAQCCLDGDAWVEPEAFLAELDRLAGADVFLPLHARYAQIRDFPALDANYRALGIVRDGEALTFSDGPDAARLRRAIMSE